MLAEPSPSFSARIVADPSRGLDGLGRFTLAVLFALCLGEALAARAATDTPGFALAFAALAFWGGVALWLRRAPPAEDVAIAGGEIVVTRAGCEAQALRLFGLKLEREADGLWLRLRDRRIEIARALPPAARAAFADRLQAALREAGA